MRLGREAEELGENLLHCHYVHKKFPLYVTWDRNQAAGIES
jgi:hypothetical protein